MARLQKSRFLALFAILSMLVGCQGGLSKAEQCNAIAKVNNDTLQAVMEGRIGKPVYDADLTRQSAQAYTSGIEAMAALDISDQKLKAVQQDLTAAYENSENLYEQMADLMPADNLPSPQLEQQISGLMQQVDKGIPGAIQAHRQYCQ